MGITNLGSQKRLSCIHHPTQSPIIIVVIVSEHTHDLPCLCVFALFLKLMVGRGKNHKVIPERNGAVERTERQRESDE